MANKAHKSFHITGSVIDSKSQNKIARLRVEAWDKDLIVDDLVGSAFTDAQGAFLIEFDRSYFKELFLDRQPDLFFKVFHDGELIKSTEDEVLWNVERGETAVVIEVNMPTPIAPGSNGDQPKPLSVKGQVHQADGSLLIGGVVRAFDKDMRSEKLLGEMSTDKEGRYEITYSAAQFLCAEKKSADLIVRLFDQRGALQLASPLIFNAQPVETVDLTLNGAAPTVASEYERLLNDLQPLMQGAAVAELTADEIRFLGGQTGNDPQHILFLVLANRHAAKIDVPAAAFYGFFRQHLPTRLEALMLQKVRRLRLALETSLQQNLIPAAIGSQVDNILEELGRPRNLLNTGEQLTTPVLGLLSTTAIPQEQQAKFLISAARHDGPTEDFWQSLRRDPDFGTEKVNELQLTLQLGLLARNHAPLVGELKKRKPAGEITSLRDLAGMEESDWLAMVHRPDVGVPDDIPGANAEEKSKNYVSGIVQLMETAFPSATAAAKLIKANRAEHSDVIQFLSTNPDFDFKSTRIDEHLSRQDERASRAAPDKEGLTKQLKGMQRVFNIAPRYDHMQALLDEGFDSARAVTTLSRTAFVEQVGAKLGGAAQAEYYYSKAGQLSETSNMIATTVAQAVNDITPWVIAKPPETIKESPNFAGLFGSSSLCDCEHCASVYSPAAYLVDVLQFLNPESGEKPLDALRQRRPDIEHIQLSCENTETPLPYIDLVNEVLEYYIAHKGQLFTSLAKDTVDITAAELSVNPQYTNNDAYNILRGSIFPLNMPFHRALEVARAYLEHLGSSRYELMKTFQADGAPSDEAIASEYLKISPKEQETLTGDTSHELLEFYGYSDDPGSPSWHENWRNHLAHVSIFLAKTGVNYADLTELLKTRFLNADQTVTLEADQISPCDLSKMKIEPLTVPILQRMHRFIRLWRKLGWTIPELDQALSALKADKITAHFLQNLSLVKQLRAELNLPVDSLLSLWSNIETAGDNPLYNRLFLNRTVVNPVDGAFSLDPSNPSTIIGDGLSDLTLSAHTSALLAALRMSAADLDLTCVELDLAADDAPLNLDNLSALYRYSVLAKALGLKVGDLISLKTLCGIDPFESPRQCRVFVDIARKVQQSEFSIAQLDYLYRHLSATTNNFAPQPARLLVLAKTLRDGLAQIAADNAIAEDPSGEFTRAKLATLFDGAIVEQVIQMVTGSAIYSAPLGNMPAAITFPPDSVEKKASYNAQTKKLHFTGPMTTDEQGDLLSTSADVKYQNAVKTLFEQPRNLIANTLAGFLDPLEATTQLLERPSLTPKGQQRPEVIANKFHYILKQLLPYLRDQLSHSLVKQTLADELELAGDMSALLLETAEILPSRTHPKQAAIKDFLALRTQGLAANYFSADDLTGVSTDRVDATLAFDGHGTTAETTVPAGSGSARWTGMLLAPNNDSYTLTVRANGGVRLWLGDDPQPLIDAPQHTSPNELSSAPVALKASQLYELQLEVTGLASPAVVELRWMGATTPKDLIPAANLYPANVFDTFTAAFTLLQKIAMLVNGFTLSASELAYLSSHAADFGHLSLARLPLDHTTEVDEEAPVRFKQWSRLNNFASLRNGLGQGDMSLIEVFDAAPSSVSKLANLTQGSAGTIVIALQRLLNAADAQPALRVDGVFDSRTATAVIAFQQSQGLNADGIVGTTTWRALRAASPNLWPKVMARAAQEEKLVNVFGWDAKTLDVLIIKMKLETEDFKNELVLVRLQTCMLLIKRLGVSAGQLIGWATSAPDANQADEITKTVKAKYDDETWLSIGKTLNDGLRQRRRDALLAYVLTEPNIIEQGIANSNQLFEYFLIDVDMDPCMMTSRIKQAISSVQLFVQRCLMNLEPQVLPSTIDEDQWEWMKNFRVWEANRKVFLYPENWIEPELRDDKSPFFKELETQLLQSDITAVTAEDAFLSYLDKLHAVARLEICGMYTQTETENDATVKILHVFGRTHQTPHIYYYRQLAGGVWTPWEKVDLDIEGNHLIPIVYNRRLYLFWPHFEEKPDTKQELEVPYVQSMEHWRWASEDHPRWEKDHRTWQTEHQRWQTVHDQWSHIHDRWQDWLDETIRVFTEDEVEDDVIDDFRVTQTDLFKSRHPEPLEDDYHPSKLYTEPSEPEEPAYSTAPALTHREIKLAWSEYRNGKWSPKQTSSEVVVSPFVDRTFKEFDNSLNLVFRVFLQELDQLYHVATKNTVVSIYLPREEEHFFRTEIEKGTEDLLVNVYRRYEREYRVLGMGPATMKGYAKLGRFRLTCGAKVKARNDLISLSFDSLSRPDGTANFFMAFEHRDGADKLSVIADGKPLEVLETFPESAGDYSLVHEHQFNKFSPPTQSFFYQDKRKSYFAHLQLPQAVEALTEKDKTPNDFDYLSEDGLEGEFNAGFVEADSNSHGALSSFALKPHIRFETFFHPHVCEFLKALYRDGIPGLLKRTLQQSDNDIKNDKTENVFLNSYKPTVIVDSASMPRENVDFDGGAYALYNWELFFHAPLFIATSLSQNQQFEDARAWFHYIFNPTTSSKLDAPQRYWKTLPFFNNSHPENDQIQQLLSALDSTDKAVQPFSEKVRQQIDEWRENPFNPHLIARLRITAYQKNVVMRYIDNLIDWADQLFSQDTIESINEATLLYVLAYNILGPKPDIIPSNTRFEPKTYSQLQEQWDDFSNAAVTFENELAISNLAYTPPITFESQLTFSNLSNSAKVGYSSKKNTFYWSKPAQAGNSAVKSVSGTFYFGIPKNDELLAYWDTVADRLFKIRHCMNIEGMVRELPLFEPPIDPALLVRATAMGLDLSSVLNDMNSPQPAYRFSHMLQKSLELCGELKSLGGALLAALEKKDAEAMSALRASHEMALLNAIRDVKKKQIDEANEALEGLSKSREVVEARRDYYRDIQRVSANEQEHMDKLGMARGFNELSQVIRAGVAMSFLMPSFDLGTAGWASSPLIKVAYGGLNVGGALQGVAELMSMIAARYAHEGTMASTKGGYDRRWDDWKQQEKVANKELNQVDKQIAAAKIRAAIAQKEKENQELQIENSQAVDAFLRSKYTNEELYNWMLSQVSAVFFQSYQLAYDMAKRAEKAYRFERGLTSSNFIQFGYWDSLRKGLLAGDKLALDLKRMEATYFDQNTRDYEITKHVSLMMNDPLALIELKETGECELSLPEALFDADYPGHYMRRLKSVSLTIPCVVGPYTSINCTLTLLSNRTRISNVVGDQYAERVDEDDPRFVSNFAAMQSIATSHAQNDGGMFELNFRDERYLPFEGAGAISRWRIDLPKETNAFDFNTLTDVVLHLKYTAREGGGSLKNGAWTTLNGMLAGDNLSLARLFSLKHEFPTEWYRFLHPADNQTVLTMKLEMTPERFAFQFRNRNIAVSLVELFLKLKDGASNPDELLNVTLTPPAGPEVSTPLTSTPAFINGIPHGTLDISAPLKGNWVLAAQKADFEQLVTTLGASDAIADIIMVYHYSVTE